MKRYIIILITLIFLTGCGVFDRGNYEKDRSGFVINDALIVKYRTNAVGEIDVFIFDERISFFEGLALIEFDATSLSSHTTLDAFVSPEELDQCGLSYDQAIPRFLSINEETYFYHIRDNGYCSYDAYQFHPTGFDLTSGDTAENLSPIEALDIMRFNQTDFSINPFTEIVFIEDIYYDEAAAVWKKELVTVVPLSVTQAGNAYQDYSDFVRQIKIIEQYVLDNQSINLLELSETYSGDDTTMVWSEETVSYLGRNHDMIRYVDTTKIEAIITLINDTLSRLGMF
ncbi:MAG: hypothetical protein K9L26_02590 [Candidatus Izimaplasma sp.]|nr:hypothetical protein [Candidatus Izimaplasma bacterium]